MSVVIYSSCRMQFISNDKQNPQHNYSDRSFVALCQHDEITDYSLRAVDVENNNTEIFNLYFKDHRQYRFGRSTNEPDEISDSNGTYRIWLSADSREQFHETFRTILELFFPNSLLKASSENSSKNHENEEPVEITKPSVPVPMNCDVKNILSNVHNLNRCIKQGDSDEASRLTTQLTSRGVRIQLASAEQIQNEEEFQIVVQVDGNEYSMDQNGETIPVKVTPSTTIRELRAAFELACHYCPTNQYFFVNGQLAQDESTMSDLRVGPNSLFVLFLLTHPKTTKN